jgi:hypothetical protein
MDMNSAQAWVVIALGVSTAIVGIITAIKVQGVHKLVNSAMTEERVENALLRSMITAKNLEMQMAEDTRKTLAAQVAHQTDLAEASKRIRAGELVSTAAQIAAMRETPPVVPPVPPVPAVPPVPPPTTPLPVILTDSSGRPIPTPLEVSVQEEKS